MKNLIKMMSIGAVLSFLGQSAAGSVTGQSPVSSTTSEPSSLEAFENLTKRLGASEEVTDGDQLFDRVLTGTAPRPSTGEFGFADDQSPTQCVVRINATKDWLWLAVSDRASGESLTWELFSDEAWHATGFGDVKTSVSQYSDVGMLISTKVDFESKGSIHSAPAKGTVELLLSFGPQSSVVTIKAADKTVSCSVAL